MPRLAHRTLAFALLALGTACASSARPSERASAASSGGDAAPQASARRDGPREMTWDEYYADVEQRARRSGGFVMWFHPPRPIRRAPQSAAPGTEALTGPPSSSGVAR